MDAAFAALDAEFARDRTLADAYLAIARLTTFVQCGHTYPNFFNQGEESSRPCSGGHGSRSSSAGWTVAWS